MDTLLHKFNNLINGTIKGFDRIVFKGCIRPIAFAAGMEFFLKTCGVLNKNYKEWVMEHSAKIIDDANQYSIKNCGGKIIYIPSSNTRKEALAHKQQKRSEIDNGLIGVWSCVESCVTFRATYDETRGYPTLRADDSRCKHLYFYYDHTDYGFMSIRLQTWAPYNIQIALNGREWLRRMLDKENCRYIISGNKFLHIDDYDLAQRLLDKQADTRWEELLSGFLPFVFPSMSQILGERMSYYWMLWQSERAKDYIFKSPEVLNPLMDDFLRHALMTGTSERVLKYMGYPVNEKGQPHPSSKPEIFTRINSWYDGVRIRHWAYENSAKLYNEQNVLRFEVTMNNPARYRIRRHKEGQKSTEPKKLLPMRKGIADITVRSQVSDNIINRFTEHMATVTNQTPVGKLISGITQPFTAKSRKIRGLEITGKDRELLQAISDPIFDVDSITNKKLQEKLKSLSWAKGMTGKQLSARISRHLRLLREHGLIKKLPNQRKYELTQKGRKITTALNVTLATSTEKLMEFAA